MQRQPTFPHRFLSAALCAAAVLASASRAGAQEPLHQRIDRAITAGTSGYAKLAAPLASDAEFLRRVYLDLAGTIPTADEARAFLKDPAPDRRARLIDRLLNAPSYARHMAEVFNVLLMDRRGGRHVPQAQWQEYLRTSFAANKPYDQLVREILSADGADPKTRAAAKFYLDRDAEPHLITRDISRLFLGMNLQCAQCHDHPLVSHYRQDHYYGVFAFLNRSYLLNDRAKKVSVFAEKAEGEVSYQSVFDPKLTKSTPPRLPGGPPLAEPKQPRGKEYAVQPGKGTAGVPAFSRRARLGALLTAPENTAFRRTAANRLWALIMGRGIIDPVEYDHPSNPPAHPELLDALGDELAALKYDVKAFLKQIALSQTYQRSSALPKGTKELPDPKTFAVAQVRGLSPEQFAWSMMQATGLTDAERKALGKKATDAAVFAKLAPNVTAFVGIFGGPAGTPDEGFQATLDQALFLQNGALMRTWLTPRPGNLMDRLGKLKDDAAVAEELYLSAFTRYPNEEERREVADYLRGRTGDRAAALQELAWAVLASAQFRFNY
ncbi:MAG: DUF1549 domain-containing protein [Gemmataceae bacterium]|nr:DUF1549 domain-containing protein [Gemmataceae bacterium]